MWFGSKGNKQKERRLRITVRELKKEMNAMGLDFPQEQEKQKVVSGFSKKTKQAEQIEDYLNSFEASNAEFADFIERYKDYHRQKIDYLDSLSGRVGEINALGIKKNKIVVSVDSANNAVIYAEGSPYVPTHQLAFEQLVGRVNRLRDRNKKRSVEKELRKITEEIGLITPEEWEKTKNKKDNTFPELVDQMVEKVINQEDVFGKLGQMIEKDLEIVKASALSKMRENETQKGD